MWASAPCSARCALHARLPRAPLTASAAPMTVQWPHNLWLMLALPLLPARYLVAAASAGKPALRLSSVSVARLASSRRWRRHVPPVLYVAGNAPCCCWAWRARPHRCTLPWARSTILLAIDDVARACACKDVQPNTHGGRAGCRKRLLHELPRHIDAGIVTFAGSAQVAQQATFDRPCAVDAIDAHPDAARHRHRQCHRGLRGRAAPGPRDRPRPR